MVEAHILAEVRTDVKEDFPTRQFSKPQAFDRARARVSKASSRASRTDIETVPLAVLPSNYVSQTTGPLYTIQFSSDGRKRLRSYKSHYRISQDLALN